MNKKDLTITLGAIADALLSIEKQKKKLAETIAIENANKDFTEEARKRKIDSWEKVYGEKIGSMKREAIKLLSQIEEHTSQPFEYNPALAQEIDYLCAMRDGKCLTGRMLEVIAEQHRGNEMELLYLRSKLKTNSLPTGYVEDLMFSSYETNINGETVFVSPKEYFEKAKDSINNSSITYSSIVLGDIQKRLGVESEGVKTLTAEVESSANADIPAVI